MTDSRIIMLPILIVLIILLLADQHLVVAKNDPAEARLFYRVQIDTSTTTVTRTYPGFDVTTITSGFCTITNPFFPLFVCRRKRQYWNLLIGDTDQLNQSQLVNPTRVLPPIEPSREPEFRVFGLPKSYSIQSSMEKTNSLSQNLRMSTSGNPLLGYKKLSVFFSLLSIFVPALKTTTTIVTAFEFVYSSTSTKTVLLTTYASTLTCIPAAATLC